MNSLPGLYFSMESYLFPAVEEEIGEITAKMKEFLLEVNTIKRKNSLTLKNCRNFDG